MHDERLYPNADEFKPERFMELDEATAKKIDPANFVFGFGRRFVPPRFLLGLGVEMLIRYSNFI